MLKVICLIFIVVALIFQGCGVTSVPSSVIISEMRQISVIATDGVLKNVNVRLASLRKGTLSKVVRTDNNGRATIEVSTNKIDQLEDHDIVYLYVDSIAGSTVSTNSSTNSDKHLNVGQVQIKSYIGSGEVLKAKATIHEKLNDDPDIGRGSIVSHFSNSVAVMIESEFKKKGLISETIKPDVAYVNLTPSNLSQVETQRKLLQDAQADRNSKLSKKLKLIAIATKALIERDVSNFLENERPTSLNRGSEAILDLAVNASANLEPDFQNQIAQLSTAVENDAQNNPDIRASLKDPEAVSKAMDFLSVNDVISATAVTDLFIELSVEKSLSSSSQYKNLNQVIDLNNQMRGGEFIGNSFVPGSEGSFVYNP